MEIARVLMSARMTIGGFAVCVLTLTASPAIAQSTVQERLKQLQAESERLQREKRTVLNELRALQVDREMRAAELEARTIALGEAAAAMTALEAQQAALADTIAREQPLVRARAVELYKHGPASDL